MYYWYGIHLIIDVCWIIVFFSFLVSKQKIFGIMSLIFLILVIATGIKLIFLNPFIFKSGGWFHAKLSIFFLLALLNIYLFKKSKFLVACYWISFFAIILILGFTMFRPF